MSPEMEKLAQSASSWRQSPWQLPLSSALETFHIPVAGQLIYKKLLIEAGTNKDIQRKHGTTALYVSAGNGHSDVCRLLIQSGANKDIQADNGTTALLISAQNGHTDVCTLLIESGMNIGIQRKDGATALFLSAQNGHTDVCEVLMEAGANKDIQIKSGATALSISAQNGHTDVCRLLIETDVNKDIQQADGSTALFLSAQNGHTDVCRLLIESGANKDIQQADGGTALFLSAQNGHTDVCRLLIESGANKDIQRSSGGTALYVSAQNGHTDVCRLLIKSGANKDIQRKDGSTALLTSAQYGRTDVCRLLIESGANTNIQEEYGATALYIGAENGQTDICSLLIESGADKDIQEEIGETALFISARNGHTDVCRLLIESAANKDIQQETGATALLISAEKGHTDVCRLLIESGANKDTHMKDGTTALYISAQNGHTDVCSLLIESGVNTDIQRETGATALYISALAGHTDICRRLIESGANKDIQKKDGETALYICAQNGHTEVCSLLIESGANMDIQNNSCWTALMAAAHFNKYDTVKLLVENNANKDQQNMYGDTALHAAAHFGYASVVKLLVDSGASVLQSKNENTPLHACFRNQDLTYNLHRKVTVAFMMTDRSIVSIKNKDGKTAINLYEEHECKQYDTERRSVQKEELLKMLKGGPLPAIDFTPSGRTIPSVISIVGPASETIYIEALEEGAVEVNLGRIKVIGQERVGKSCLINACLGKKFNPDEEITDAIATIKIVTKTAEEPNKWAENLTDCGSATEIYQKSMADAIMRKTIEHCGVERIDEAPLKEEHNIKHETSTQKPQVARKISDKGGSTTDISKQCMADAFIRKKADNSDVKRKDESSSEKGKTKPETPTETVVRAISFKGEVKLKTKVPRVNAFQTENMPTAIRKKVDEGFDQGIYYKKQGMGEWFRIGKETFNIWDYGGQVIYHGIHRIFMTSEAVYIVVFKLNVDLDAKAIVQDSSGRYRTHHLTNLEFILYWILSVYTHSRQLADDMTREICLPAIVLVGTHRDSLGANEEERIYKVEEAFKKISDALVGKPYEKHVYPKYFDIENNRSDIDKNTAELKKVLANLMTTLIKSVPLKWMRLRCELQKLRIEKLVCPLKEVKELATKCGIDDEKQCVLLNFLYDLGEIIYMPDNDALKDDVVLDPMGFVDIARTVITVIPPKLPTAMFKESFRKLDKGILEEHLLRNLWKKRGIDLAKFDFFVELMMRFCLLCERKTSKTSAGSRSFFVPLRFALEPPSEEQWQVDSYGMRAISIYHDFCGYLPDELFPQIVTEFINKFQNETGDEPELAHDHAELYFDQYHHVILSVATFETKRNERKRMLMTTILRREAINDRPTRKDREPSSKACKEVLEFLEASFNRSQQGGRRGLQFQRCIPCICSKNTAKKHMQMLRNFEEEMLPCKRDGMNVVRYKRIFGDLSDTGLKEQLYSEDWSTISQCDYLRLLNVVSKWWHRHGNINMLKVLLRQFRPKVNQLDLQRTDNVHDLFMLLGATGELSQSKLTVIFEAIKLCGLDGVDSKVQAIVPSFQSFDEVDINIFSHYRQKLIRFGKRLSMESITTIGHVTDIDKKVYRNDQWLLICALEDKGKIKENSLTGFIQLLRDIDMDTEADILVERPY